MSTPIFRRTIGEQVAEIPIAARTDLLEYQLHARMIFSPSSLTEGAGR